jgi:hypothetical protein
MVSIAYSYYYIIALTFLAYNIYYNNYKNHDHDYPHKIDINIDNKNKTEENNI